MNAEPETKVRLRRRWFAWSIWTLTACLASISVVFVFLNGFASFPDPFCCSGFPSILTQLMALACSTVGALIVARKPGNPIGWIFTFSGLGISLNFFALNYAIFTGVTRPGSLPYGSAMAWLAGWIWIPGWWPILAFLLLLFPSGRLLSRRWQPVAYLVVLVLAANVVVRMFKPGVLDWSVPAFENPLGAGGAFGNALRWAETWVFSLLLISTLVSALSLIVRFIDARGIERQQIKWLAYASSLAGSIVALATGLLYGNAILWNPWVETVLFLPLLGIPISVGIAILRHRLFDIDLLINRTLVYFTLTAVIAGFYVLVVGSLSGLLHRQNDLAAPAIALLMAAALVQPLRRALQEAVNHFVPGVVIRDSTAPPVPQIKQEQKVAVADSAAVAAMHGPWWLVPAHAAWWVCAAFALLTFLAAIPLGYAQRFSGTFDVLIDAPAWYLVFMSVAQAAISMLTALVCLTLAALLFWNRRQEPMTLFVSFFLMAYGIVLAGPLEALNGFPLLSAAPPSYGSMVISTDVVYKMQTALFAVMPVLFYLFPSGRFVPGWTRYPALLALLLVPVVIRTFSTDWPSMVTPFAWSYAALVGIGIYAQIYRYRRVATPLERQQTKWVVFGVVLTFVMLTGLQIPYSAAISIPAGVGHPWWQPLTGLVWFLSLMILPLSLAIAVMGYRLWHIDLIISRTLVYGVLTASVVALYVLIVGWLSIGLRTSALPASVFAILIISILFHPLRRGLQGITDRFVPVPQSTAGMEQHESRLAITQGHAAADTTLRGRWLLLVRVTWAAVLLTLTVMYAFAFLAMREQLSTVCEEEPCTLSRQIRQTGAGEKVLNFGGPPIGYANPLRPEQVEAIGRLGLTLDQYGWLAALQTGVPVLIYLVIAAVLFWRKSDNWMVLFVSIMVATIPFQNQPLPFILAARQPAWDWIYAPAEAVALGCLLIFPLIFPTGAFVPRWTRWLALPAFACAVTAAWLRYSMNEGTPANQLIVGYIVFSFVNGIYAQLYRYSRASSPIERQQIKWVVAGLAVFIFTAMTVLLPLDRLLMARAGGMDPARALVLSASIDTIFHGISLFIPVSIVISILRYRVWDIDLIINRTLVYGALTGIVAGAFVLMVGSVGSLIQSSSNPITAILATGLVALLFNPLRQRLQRGVNRLMYGERDEPYAALSRLGRRLGSSLAPGEVLPTVVTTVREALKLPYVAIYLQNNSHGYNIVAESAAPSLRLEGGRIRVPGMEREGLCMPLMHQGETVGYIVLGPRAPTEAFNSTDLRLLNDLAPQVGVAVHAARLTADLQRSREDLVLAREEERLRLRRDLHDGLGPQLAGLALRLETARNRLGDNEEAAALLTDLSARTQEAVADIRRLVYGLRPPALDELGLLMAFRESVTRFNEQQCASCTNIVLEAPESLPALPAAVEVAAYRIAQEGLNNVVLHAEAQTCFVRLQLDERGGFLCLDIQDDGKGLPPKRHAGVGLNSMRERAEELGGSLTITSAPTGGTHLSARLPYRSGEGSRDASLPAEGG